MSGYDWSVLFASETAYACFFAGCVFAGMVTAVALSFDSFLILVCDWVRKKKNLPRREVIQVVEISDEK